MNRRHRRLRRPFPGSDHSGITVTVTETIVVTVTVINIVSVTVTVINLVSVTVTVIAVIHAFLFFRAL